MCGIPDRFGKLLRLEYCGDSLLGARIQTYLLEKTRVTHQPSGETNFHVLHQVCPHLCSPNTPETLTSQSPAADCRSSLHLLPGRTAYVDRYHGYHVS